MGIFSSLRSAGSVDLLTFGRSGTMISSVVAAETVFFAATFFFAQPPFLPIPFDDSTTLFITGIFTLTLSAILYILLSSLGYQTYSVRFHYPVHILKCSAAYLTLSTFVIYVGYLLFVFPYTGRLVPELVDIGIGAVFSAAYAVSIAGIVYGEDYFTDSTDTKQENINQFLTAAEDLREKPESEIVDEPDQLIQAGDSLLTGLQKSDLHGTKDLASDLQDWLQTFKQRELQGQRKMVGNLPDSDTTFEVWKDRYEAFEGIQEELRKMDVPATHRVLLSIRGK